MAALTGNCRNHEFGFDLHITYYCVAHTVYYSRMSLRSSLLGQFPSTENNALQMYCPEMFTDGIQQLPIIITVQSESAKWRGKYRVMH